MKWGKVGNFGEGIGSVGKIGEGCQNVGKVPLDFTAVFHLNHMYRVEKV